MLFQEETSLGAPGAAPPWYALYTRHQHEKVVARVLERKGLEIFLPLYEATRRWKDRWKRLALPLFPCYVFVRTSLERRLDMLSAPGVFSIVGFGQPAAIPYSEIEAIRRVIGSDMRIQPYPFLKCGDWVRVKSGALAGIEGILVRKKNLARLVLSVEILGRSAAIEVDALSVERISPRPLNRGTLVGPV